MTFDEYQKKARQVAIYPNKGNNIIYPALGLCGEAGEVAEKIKKILRDKGGNVSIEDRESIAYELGDALWYIYALADELELSLDDIARMNLEKLFSRKRRGKLQGDGDDR